MYPAKQTGLPARSLLSPLPVELILEFISWLEGSCLSEY